MKKAAVAELKASLSRFLAGVKAGEEVLVTERGRPIARIVPVTRDRDEEEQRLRRMEVEGLIRIGSRKLPRAFWDLSRPSDPEGSVRRALIEERIEGR